MSIQTDSRSNDRTFRWSYDGGSSVLRERSMVRADLMESVTSFRGKIEEISFHGKKKRVYHPFSRWHFSVTGEAGGWWWPDGVSGHRINNADYHIKSLLTNYETYGMDMPVEWTQGGNLAWPILETELRQYGEHLRAHCISDMYEKAKSPRFETAVFLAELDETLVGIYKLITGSVKTLCKAETAWKHIKHFSLNSEELWLWYRYALLPAMLSIEDLLSAIKPQDKITRLQDGSRDTIFVHGSHRWGPQWRKFYPEVCWKTRLKYGCGSAIDIRFLHDPSPWGTSATDCLRAAYERIPFSFVFDWFVNLNKWLTCLRDVHIEIAQSYGTFALEAITEFSYPDWNDVREPHVVKTLVIDRIINVDAPDHPLVDKRWANALRTIDLISLTIGTVKTLLKKNKRR